MFSENGDGQGQPTENEENKESCPEDNVRGNTTALNDPRWHYLAEV